MRAFLVFLFVGTLVYAQVLVKPSTNTLVLTNVNIVNTRTGQVQRNSTVVVKDGKIQAIARFGFIEEGRALRVVNGNGKYLIPGLWDMHVHSAGGPAAAWDENVIYPLYVANGVTGIRDMGGDPDLLQQRHDRIERGELPGPTILFAGPFLDGRKSENGLKQDPQVIPVNTPAEGEEAVRSLHRRGVDFVKVLSGVPHDAYIAIAKESYNLRMRLVGHVPESVSVGEAAISGQRSIEHLSGVLLACSSQESQLRQELLNATAKQDQPENARVNRKILATYNAEKADTLFLELADNNTYQVPTLVWWQASARMADPGMADDPRLKYVPAWAHAEWDSAKLHTQAAPNELSDMQTLSSRYIELVRAMHRIGVPFMAGTDGPDPYVYPGFSLHDELELLVKAGFSNTEALQAATFYPALFLIKLDKYGVVEPGHFADLVLLDGNPIEDIHNTTKISAVILRGKYYSRSDLDGMLAGAHEIAMRPTPSVALGQHPAERQ